MTERRTAKSLMVCVFGSVVKGGETGRNITNYLRVHTATAQQFNCLTDTNHRFVDDGVGGDLEVPRCWSTADTSGAIIMGSVARTVVATVVTGVSDGYTTKMSTHTNDDQPIMVYKRGHSLKAT